MLECAAEILVDISKTYHHCFLLKPSNVEGSCDFIYKIGFVFCVKKKKSSFFNYVLIL